MPGTHDMMEAIRNGLNKLPLTVEDTNKEWTKAIKTMLCELGEKKYNFQVCASGLLTPGYGEWLYDVTWLEYSQGYAPGLQNHLVDVHLAAECEWGGFGEIKKDFEKLLPARTTLRLMIYDGNQDPGSEAIAEHLGGYIRNFRGFQAEDVWLLAAWERHAGGGTWAFKYFEFGRFATQQRLF